MLMYSLARGSPAVDARLRLRIYSNKRRGAYLIFVKLYHCNFTFSIFLFNGTLSIC